MANLVGICLGAESINSTTIGYMQELGVNACRFDLKWAVVETIMGQYTNWSIYDNAFNLLQAAGITPVAILDYNNPLYAASEFHGIAGGSANANGFAIFMWTALLRYANRNTIWEIWNEPANDNSEYWLPQWNAVDYFRLLERSLPDVKSGMPDPTGRFIAPALAYNGNISSFLSTLGYSASYTTGLYTRGWLDGISVHPYAAGVYPETVANDVTNLVTNIVTPYTPLSTFNLGIFNSEMGYSKYWSGQSELLKSQYISRHCVMNAARGQASIIYTLIEDGQGFGLIDGTTKNSSFYLLKKIAPVLTSKNFSSYTYNNYNGAYALKFINPANADDECTIAWCTGANQSVTIYGKTVTVTNTPVVISKIPALTGGSSSTGSITTDAVLPDNSVSVGGGSVSGGQLTLSHNTSTLAISGGSTSSGSLILDTIAASSAPWLGGVVNIGICVGGWDVTTINRCLELGVSHVRIDGGVQWHQLETGSQRNYNFNNLYSCLSSFIGAGLKVIWIIDYNNPLWGGQNIDGFYGTGLLTNNNRLGYKDFCVAAANYIASQGWLDKVALELWNESDIPIYWKNSDGSWMSSATKGPQFAAAINLAVPAIKAAQPNCIVTTFAANAPSAYESGDINNVWSDYASQSIPYVTSDTWNKLYSYGSHPYTQAGGVNLPPESTASGTPYEMYHNVNTLFKKYGMPATKRCWITECGYNTPPATGEVSQTDANMLNGYLARFILQSILWGSTDFSVYNLNGTTWYGVYDQGTQPARRNIFRDLCRAINGATYVQRLSSASGDYLLEFTKGGVKTCAAYTTGSNHNVTIYGQTVTLAQVPKYITQVITNTITLSGGSSSSGSLILSHTNSRLTLSGGSISNGSMNLPIDLAGGSTSGGSAVLSSTSQLTLAGGGVSTGTLELPDFEISGGSISNAIIQLSALSSFTSEGASSSNGEFTCGSPTASSIAPLGASSTGGSLALSIPTYMEASGGSTSGGSIDTANISNDSIVGSSQSAGSIEITGESTATIEGNSISAGAINPVGYPSSIDSIEGNAESGGEILLPGQGEAILRAGSLSEGGMILAGLSTIADIIGGSTSAGAMLYTAINNLDPTGSGTSGGNLTLTGDSSMEINGGGTSHGSLACYNMFKEILVRLNCRSYISVELDTIK